MRLALSHERAIKVTGIEDAKTAPFEGSGLGAFRRLVFYTLNEGYSQGVHCSATVAVRNAKTTQDSLLQE
jgi:hypothetical protein